jgi:hypothetical protein
MRATRFDANERNAVCAEVKMCGLENMPRATLALRRKTSRVMLRKQDIGIST